MIRAQNDEKGPLAILMLIRGEKKKRLLTATASPNDCMHDYTDDLKLPAA